MGHLRLRLLAHLSSRHCGLDLAPHSCHDVVKCVSNRRQLAQPVVLRQHAYAAGKLSPQCQVPPIANNLQAEPRDALPLCDIACFAAQVGRQAALIPVCRLG